MLLDDLVQHELFLQRRGGVDLKQPALQIRIDEDIVAKQLEAVGVLRNGVHAGYQRLQYDLLYLFFYLLPGNATLLHPLPQHLQGYLTAAQLLLQRQLLLGYVLAIYAEIGEVDVLVVHFLLVQRVALCAQPCEALLVDEGLERVDGGDEDVDAHVELEAVH